MPGQIDLKGKFMMRIWKKFAAAALLCVTIVFSACGGKTAPAAAQPMDKESLVKTITGLTGDDGQPLFTEPAQPGPEELRDVYGIDSELLTDSIILIDQNWNFCMLLIPGEGKSNDVKNMMSSALNDLSQQLELYEPAQSQRVKERLETMRGDYLVYAASAGNDKILEAIEKAVG